MRTQLLHSCRVIVVVVLAVAVFAAPAYADAISVVVQRVDASQFPNVTAYVSVANSSGAPVTGLDARSFVVQEDGKPVTAFAVDSGAGDQDPIATALVVDVSASSAETLASAKDAAAAYVDVLGANDRGTVVTFASRVTVVQDYTADRSALRSAIDSLAAGGNRVLYDAIAQTARRQAAQPEHRRPIIVLSLGRDSTSIEGLESAIQAATSVGSPVYVIGFGSAVNRDDLSKITGATGGRAVFVSSAADLKPTYVAIGDQVRREYVLQYASTIRADAAAHGLAIQLTSGALTGTGLGSFVAPAPPQVAAPTPVTVPPTPVPVAAPASPATSVDPNLLIGLVLLLVLAGAAIWYVTHGNPSPPVTVKQTAGAEPPTMSRGDQTWIVDGGGGDRTQVRPGRARTPPQVHLAIVKDGQPSEFVSRESPITIGRAQDRVNVLIADPLVSGEHARIRRDDSQFFLEDLTSKNGTRLNGEPIAPGQPRPLKNNDRIYIGDAVVTFVVDSR